MPKQTHPFRSQITESFEAKALKKRSFGVRFADDLTSLFGSMLFLFLNATIFTGWILINTGKVPGIPIFDPFPFSMLTTVVSLEAIILTVIVLMSQNRQSLISSMREEIDIQVNLIAEREITKILKLLTEYLKVKGIKVEDPELEDMLKDIDASYIERSLEKELTTKSPKLVDSVTKPIIKVGKEVEKAAEEVEKTILPKK